MLLLQVSVDSFELEPAQLLMPARFEQESERNQAFQAVRCSRKEDLAEWLGSLPRIAAMNEEIVDDQRQTDDRFTFDIRSIRRAFACSPLRAASSPRLVNSSKRWSNASITVFGSGALTRGDATMDRSMPIVVT